MTRPVLQLTHGRHADAAHTVPTLDEALAIMGLAASSRISNPEAEEDRVALLGVALGAARAANAALHMWVAQCLSEYRGSRTTWDIHATSELLGRALSQFDETARETAERLMTLMPDVAAEHKERWHPAGEAF